MKKLFLFLCGVSLLFSGCMFAMEITVKDLSPEALALEEAVIEHVQERFGLSEEDLEGGSFGILYRNGFNLEEKKPKMDVTFSVPRVLNGFDHLWNYGRKLEK